MLHAAALWIWHVPLLFDAALDSEALHAIQHFSFVATAGLFWWGMVNGRYGRIGYGAGVFYIFLTAVHSSALGALVTLVQQSGTPRIPTRRSGTWTRSPISSSQAF